MIYLITHADNFVMRISQISQGAFGFVRRMMEERRIRMLTGPRPI
jgi:hypothetical protein